MCVPFLRPGSSIDFVVYLYGWVACQMCSPSIAFHWFVVLGAQTRTSNNYTNSWIPLSSQSDFPIEPAGLSPGPGHMRSVPRSLRIRIGWGMNFTQFVWLDSSVEYYVFDWIIDSPMRCDNTSSTTHAIFILIAYCFARCVLILPVAKILGDNS